MEELPTLKPAKRTRPKARTFWASPAGEAEKARQRMARTGRPNPKNLGRTGPGRTKTGTAILSWRLARGLTSGKSQLDLAEQFKMGLRAVSARAESISLAPGAVFLCDQGIVFRDKSLTAIRTAVGFRSAAAFEEIVELRPGTCSARKNGPEAIRDPETARLVLAWRGRAIWALTKDKTDKVRFYHNHEVIRTLLPELASLQDALVETFGRSVGRYPKATGIQAELLEHPAWRIEEVWNFVCDRVQEGAPDAWHRTLCYLWEIESILAGKLDRLRKTDSIATFVREILGERYGVHPQQIKLAIQEGTRTIPPAEMLGLVQFALDAVPTPAKRGRGRPSGLDSETSKRIRVAGALQKLYGKDDIVWKDHAGQLFPFAPGTAESNTHNFVSEHRARIKLAAESLTPVEAAALLREIPT